MIPYRFSFLCICCIVATAYLLPCSLNAQKSSAAFSEEQKRERSEFFIRHAMSEFAERKFQKAAKSLKNARYWDKNFYLKHARATALEIHLLMFEGREHEAAQTIDQWYLLWSDGNKIYYYYLAWLRLYDRMNYSALRAYEHASGNEDKINEENKKQPRTVKEFPYLWPVHCEIHDTEERNPFHAEESVVSMFYKTMTPMEKAQSLFMFTFLDAYFQRVDQTLSNADLKNQDAPTPDFHSSISKINIREDVIKKYPITYRYLNAPNDKTNFEKCRESLKDKLKEEKKLHTAGDSKARNRIEFIQRKMGNLLWINSTLHPNRANIAEYAEWLLRVGSYRDSLALYRLALQVSPLTMPLDDLHKDGLNEAASPATNENLKQLATIYSQMGELYLFLGDSASSISSFRIAKTINKILNEEHPMQSSNSRQLAMKMIFDTATENKNHRESLLLQISYLQSRDPKQIDGIEEKLKKRDEMQEQFEALRASALRYGLQTPLFPTRQNETGGL